MALEIVDGAWEALTGVPWPDDFEREQMVLARLCGRSKAIALLLAGTISSLREAEQQIRELQADQVRSLRQTTPPPHEAGFEAGRRSAMRDHDAMVRDNKGYDPECRCQHGEMYVGE